jgi:hypothetical protein
MLITYRPFEIINFDAYVLLNHLFLDDRFNDLPFPAPAVTPDPGNRDLSLKRYRLPSKLSKALPEMLIRKRLRIIHRPKTVLSHHVGNPDAPVFGSLGIIPHVDELHLPQSERNPVVQPKPVPESVQALGSLPSLRDSDRETAAPSPVVVADVGNDPKPCPVRPRGVTGKILESSDHWFPP